MTASKNPLASVIGIEESNWMMSPGERLAILGLLATMKPESTLELGCADGGLTAWLSQYSKQVVTVDVDSKVLAVTQPFANVLPLCMTTDAAAAWIRSEHRHFDLTILDADHSKVGMHRDLNNALDFSDVIIMHDTYYPPCREGILEVLKGRDIYCNLELVPGGLQPDGLWGGLGIILPQTPRRLELKITPRVSAYAALRILWQLKGLAHSSNRAFRRVKSQIGKVKRDLRGVGSGNLKV